MKTRRKSGPKKGEPAKGLPPEQLVEVGKKTRFSKGKSGNPSGVSKVTLEAKAALEQAKPALAAKFIEMALDGNESLLRELTTYVFGAKPKHLTIGGANGAPPIPLKVEDAKQSVAERLARLIVERLRAEPRSEGAPGLPAGEQPEAPAGVRAESDRRAAEEVPAAIDGG